MAGWKIQHLDGMYQEKWGYSIGMLVYQRVYMISLAEISEWKDLLAPFC